VLPPPVFQAIGKRDVVSGGGGEMSYSGRQSSRRVGAGRTRRRCRRLARHCGRLHQVCDRDADRRVAAEKKVDPVAYRLEMLKDDPRAAAVVKAVAGMSKWGEKRQGGRAVGIAYSDALHSHNRGSGRGLARRQVRQDHGPPCLGRVDAGLAVQPRNIVAQMKGAMTFVSVRR